MNSLPAESATSQQTNKNPLPSWQQQASLLHPPGLSLQPPDRCTGLAEN